MSTEKTSNLQLSQLVDAIKSLSIEQAASLVKDLEEALGIDASMPVFAGGNAGAAEAEAVSEPDSFKVVLKEIGTSQVSVIKVVKDELGLNLMAAKEFISETPKVIKEGLNKEEANQLKERLETAGAKVSIDAV